MAYYDDELDLLDEEERKKHLPVGPMPPPGYSSALGGVMPLRKDAGAQLQEMPPAAPKPQSITGMAAPATQAPPVSITTPPLERPAPTPTLERPAAAAWQKHALDQPGISKKHGIGGGILKALEMAGTVMFPDAMSAVPGSRMNFSMEGDRLANEANEEARLAQDTAHTGMVQKQTEMMGQKVGLTPEETTIHDLMTGEGGQPRLNPDTQKPYSYLEAYQAVQEIKSGAKTVNQNPEQETFRDLMTGQNGQPRINPDTQKPYTRAEALEVIKSSGKTPGNQSTKEQIIKQLDSELAKPKPDRTIVKNLQDRLRAIDPLAEDRIRDAEARSAEAAARSAETKKEFQPAIAGQVVMQMSTQKATRRLLDILRDSKDDNQPFSHFLQTVEYRFGRAQADAIGQELASINLTSLQQAGAVLKTMGGVRAARVLEKVLQHTPDPMHDSTKNMYDKLTNIDRAIATFLSDADKYGRKGAAELPPESMKPYEGTGGRNVLAGASHEVYAADGTTLIGYIINGKYLPLNK